MEVLDVMGTLKKRKEEASRTEWCNSGIDEIWWREVNKIMVEYTQ